MDLNLSGKHALVCGGSQGIGRAAAFALAELGADVTVLARTRTTLEAMVATLPRSGAQAHAALAVDMGDLAAFRQHLLANQAVVAAVLPGMQRAAWGRIVNVISTSVKEPIKGLGVSNTIRGAVASWAKTLATELGPFGITVNNVLPGYTRTQRLDQILADRAKASGKPEGEIAQAMLASVPAGRFADAGEIAAAVAFLCSPAAGYINGINLPVDGGRTLSL